MPKRTSSKTLAGPRASAKTASHTTTNKANSNTNINTISELRELSILLTALRTRNKNQHRRSVWWAHFEQFRKFVIRLVDQSTAGNGETPVQTLETVRTKKVGKWHRAFKQLVSDNQFAALGLVLLAALARVVHLLGIDVFGDVNELQGANEGRTTEELEKGAQERGLVDLGQGLDRDEMDKVDGEDKEEEEQEEEWEGFSD
ncbi:hypothetical protein LTS18_012693 [Coniosporium uncinatum]|uniref:Uncharacterized protein n=1 Tax=Coniosporium uncinatum TaxID=93489 RepID=A0ACC3DWD6_9PEZI|nr:hypothetical protein LTS18_012693 [Coniosporium uncinatum]